MRGTECLRKVKFLFFLGFLLSIEKEDKEGEERNPRIKRF